MNPTEKTTYVLIRDGYSGVIYSQVSDEESAVKLAKDFARESGARVNVFKLIQSHTFHPAVCNNCGEHTITGGHVMTGEVAQ